MTVSYGSLPFDEAERFFRDKVRIPTERWDDLKHGMHARGFMIAGAKRDDMLCDFQTALRKAVEKGTTLEEFRGDFDRIVSTYGWSYNGGQGWRTRVMYDTNLRTSYMAGRYKQMIDPDVLAYRPYWMYRHNDARRPRPLHVSWNGITLRADDPWWSTHYTPNGWGCHCTVEPQSMHDMDRMGKTGPDQAPPSPIDPKTGEPIGIDKGWGYNVGEAAWGRPMADKTMGDFQASGKSAWQRITPGNWREQGQDKRLPIDTAKAAPLPSGVSGTEAVQTLKKMLGGEEKILTAPAGGRVLVNAEAISAHVDSLQASSLPLIPETIEDPAEIWLAFEQHRDTGLVALRTRYVKAIGHLKTVAQVNKGVLEDWSVQEGESGARVGKLLWQRGDD